MEIGNNSKQHNIEKNTTNISGSKSNKSENLKIILMIKIIVIIRILITEIMIASITEVVIEILITVVKMIYKATSMEKKKLVR